MSYRKPAMFAGFGMVIGAMTVVGLVMYPPTEGLSNTPAGIAPPSIAVEGQRPASESLRYSRVSPAAFAHASRAPEHGGDGREDMGVQLAAAPTAPSQTQTEDETLLAALPSEPTVREEVLTVGRGDTLVSLLVNAGVDRTEAYQSIEAFSDVFDPRRLRAGDSITVSFLTSSDDAEAFRGFALEPDAVRRMVVERTEDGAFAAAEFQSEITTETLRAEGQITSSLFAAASEMGLSPRVMAEFIRIFSYDVDFQRDIRRGDSFSVLYTEDFAPNGESVGTPTLHYVAMTLSGDQRAYYRFEEDDDYADFFSADGKSIRKGLMRTPIDGARISSGFGTRHHPILGYTAMHRGVDFAAPTGTPIYAAGDGVVERASPNGAYGNYILIRHNSEYSTAYAHLSRFARGLTPGKRVRQGDIIGYVGTTGRSTGPHLHYEVVRSGQQINPMTARLPAGRELEGEERVAFESQRRATEQLFASLPSISRVARAD